MLCAADMQVGKVFIVFFRISSFFKKYVRPNHDMSSSGRLAHRQRRPLR
jgi:hypothetical protein